MKTLKDFNFGNKRVLVRCDFNVPLSFGEGWTKRSSSSSLPSFPSETEVLDDFRIRQALRTINYLIEQTAKVILMSHLGRPEGRVVENLRLSPIQDKLTEYLELSVVKAEDCVGSEIEKRTFKMQKGEILLLENLRFHREEEENDENFAKELSKLGDIYINDAFGASHRAHASIVGIPKYLPAGAGFLLEEEIKILTNLIENPQKPLVAIVGGAKGEDKAGLFKKISEVADFILIGGLIKREIENKNIKLKYPQKVLGPIDEIEGKDVGQKTIDLFKEKINKAKTVFWNGPLGMIEKEEFSKGTKELAEAIVKSSAFSIIGGGETVEFINKLGLTEKIGHVSTGGGAMLEFLSGNKLPGLEALEK